MTAPPPPSVPATALTWSTRLRLRLSDLGRGLLGLGGATVGLELSSWLVPGFTLQGWVWALAAAVMVTFTGAWMRPLMVRLAARLGWLGAVLLATLGQAFIVWWVVRGSAGSGVGLFFASMVAAWIVALATTAVVWVFSAGTDEAVTASLVRKAHRRQARGKQAILPDGDVPGVVFVQADGVPFPLLELGVLTGTLPTLSRWVRSGSHAMAEWRPRLPATTPASQLGILHGTIEGIPAFRWVDRATGRVFVANRPADAADIEALHSDGHGLLADDGVSVSNLFSGDAATAYATMSAIHRTQESLEVRRAVSRFLARPEGLARGMSRTLSEIVRERFQANRARRRDVRPRVHRGWGFALERAALSGVLRDLNTALVAHSMLDGRRSIYVDYVDYDAVAHHAGVFRPEALDALAGIDAVLGQLEKVADVAPRPYHLVVLSDHGQSQGEVFADRYGEDLAALVARLAGADVSAALAPDAEGVGRLAGLSHWAGPSGSILGRTLDPLRRRLDDRGHADAERAAASERARWEAPPEASVDAEEFLVFGSGNLGLVYVAGEHHRLGLEELSERYPALVPGLVLHPGIAFAVVQTASHGPVALGADGEHQLTDGTVVGTDPLARFGPHAADFALRVAGMPEAPDILVNSIVDRMGEVAAFEGLVGCHGGLGGWQDRAMIVAPSALPLPEDLVVGADALHDVLIGWLELLGHRRDLPPARSRRYNSPGPQSPGPSDSAAPRSPEAPRVAG